MALSISENLFSRSNCSEEFLSSSQLLISSSIQSFCKESSSFSAIFSLGAAQTIACLVKAHSFYSLSSLFTSPARLPLFHKISSGLGLIAEGAAFPLAGELGRTGELHFATWQETAHGTVTMGVCKIIGKKLQIGNVILRHFVQDCAMVTVDLGFEGAGIIDKKHEEWISRLAGAEIASFRLEISAQLLACTAPGLSFIRAKQEIKLEVYKSNQPQGSSHFWDPLKQLFSPSLAANNGETFKQHFFSERKPIVQAKDLIHRMEGKSEQSEPEDPLSFLPPTAKQRLSEVWKVKPKAARILGETWKQLYDGSRYLQDVCNRGELVRAYRRAVLDYCAERPHVDVSTLEEFGVAIFFSQIPEGENYSYPFPPETIGTLGADAIRNAIKRRKKKPPTLEEFETLEKERPNLAIWVKRILAFWSTKNYRPYKYDGAEEKKNEDGPERSSLGVSTPVEMATRAYSRSSDSVLRLLSPPIDLELFYHEALPAAVKFFPFQEEILNRPQSINLPTVQLLYDLNTLHSAPDLIGLIQRAQFPILEPSPIILGVVSAFARMKPTSPISMAPAAFLMRRTGICDLYQPARRWMEPDPAIAQAREVEIAKRKKLNRFNAEQRRKYFLALLPPTARKRLLSLQGEQHAVGRVLEATWRALYETDRYLMEIESPSSQSVFIAYRNAARNYLRENTPHDFETIYKIIELGKAIFFDRIPKDESYYLKPPPADEVLYRVSNSLSERVNDALTCSRGIEPTTQDILEERFHQLVKRDKNLARGVLVSLLAWEEEFITHFSALDRGEATQLRNFQEVARIALQRLQYLPGEIDLQIIPEARSLISISKTLLEDPQYMGLTRYWMTHHSQDKYRKHRIGKLAARVSLREMHEVETGYIEAISDPHESSLFSMLLRSYILLHGYKTSEVAEKFEVTENNFHKYLAGTITPHSSRLFHFLNSDPTLSRREKRAFYLARYPMIFDLDIVDEAGRVRVGDWSENVQALTFGELLQRRREQLGLSRSQVAQALEVSDEVIHRYEEREHPWVSWEHLPTLAKTLSLDCGLITVKSHPEIWNYLEVELIQGDKDLLIHRKEPVFKNSFGGKLEKLLWKYDVRKEAILEPCDISKAQLYLYITDGNKPNLSFCVALFVAVPEITTEERADLVCTLHPEIVSLEIFDAEKRIQIQEWDESLRSMTAGEIIQKRREQLGLSKEKLGREIGVSAPSITAWEDGSVQTISWAYLEPLSKTLKLDRRLLAVKTHSALEDAFEIVYTLSESPILEEEIIPTYEDPTLGGKIRGFVTSRNLEPKDFLPKLKISRGHYYNYLANRRTPPVTFLLDLFALDPKCRTKEKLDLYFTAYPAFADLGIVSKRGKIKVRGWQEEYRGKRIGYLAEKHRKAGRYGIGTASAALQISNATYLKMERDEMSEIDPIYIHPLAETLKEDLGLVAVLTRPELWEITEIELI